MIAFILSCDDSCGELSNLGYFTFPDINLFDKSLSYYQDLCIECGEKTTKYQIDNSDVSRVKKIIDETKEEYSIFFYENCFFDFLLSDIISFHKQSGSVITFFSGEEKLVFALISNKKIKKILLEKFSYNTIEQLLKANCEAQSPYFYYKFLSTYHSYKKLNHDILDNKTNIYLSCVAKGVFTDGSLPKGDYTIVPPVYISGESQIENGSIIGPASVILKNTLVAESTHISKSVLSENTFVSRECLVENSLCGINSTVKKGGAVLSECVLGYNSVLGDDLLLENGAVILPEAKIFNCYENCKNDFLCVVESSFKNLDVLSACKLGYIFGEAFNSPSICIGNDDSIKSSVIKLAFISGATASGCDCYDIGSSFLSKLFYTEGFCNLKYGVFFTCEENVVSLRIYNQKCDKLNSSDLYNILYFFKCRHTDFSNNLNVKKIKQIKGISKLYLRDLKRLIPERLNSQYNIDCANFSIKKVIENIFKTKISNSNNTSNISFIIDEKGCNLHCVNNGKIYENYQLVEAMDKLCESRSHDSFVSSLYRKDALFLVFTIIAFLEESKENYKKFLKFLTSFRVINREILLNKSTGVAISKLLFNGESEYKNGRLYIINKGREVSIGLNTRGKNLRLTSKCYDAESSKEISDTFDLLLGDINKL